MKSVVQRSPWLFGMIVALGVFACQLPVEVGSGALDVSIADAVNARTLLPPISMEAAKYRVDGTGPGGATFSELTTGAPVTVKKLAFGDWTILVQALNPGCEVIGSGEATCVVHTGVTTPVEVVVRPIVGTGALDLHLSWNVADVETPSVLAFLVPPTGDPTELAFAVDGGTASFAGPGFAHGYQTLTVQLLDNGIPVMGAMEVARIVAGQTTSGSFDFSKVNKPGGAVIVNITPELADPIAVGITGVPAILRFGDEPTATISVGDGSLNAVCEWYLNGSSFAMGETCVLRDLPLGHYRLDAKAFTADGLRAGSASVEFDVAPWLEDFESYPVGVYPAGWYNLWSGLSGNVVEGPAYSGTKSFRLEGRANWTRDDGIDLDLSGVDVLTYEAAVMVPTGSGTGGIVGFFVRTGPVNSIALNCVTFHPGDKIWVSGAEGAPTCVDCVYDRWYHVKVRIDYVALTMNVWIDGQKAVTDLPARAKAESRTFHVGTLWSPTLGQVACFDDIAFY